MFFLAKRLNAFIHVTLTIFFLLFFSESRSDNEKGKDRLSKETMISKFLFYPIIIQWDDSIVSPKKPTNTIKDHFVLKCSSCYGIKRQLLYLIKNSLGSLQTLVAYNDQKCIALFLQRMYCFSFVA